ncbi:hypothetical protein ACFY0N_00255 [Streptomyces vinaceus]|uniref:hypothetical protein n=1 Tax=Streptomyces vinaceus TaxID=1960 RepID=UPI00367ABEDF
MQRIVCLAGEAETLKVVALGQTVLAGVVGLPPGEIGHRGCGAQRIGVIGLPDEASTGKVGDVGSQVLDDCRPAVLAALALVDDGERLEHGSDGRDVGGADSAGARSGAAVLRLCGLREAKRQGCGGDAVGGCRKDLSAIDVGLPDSPYDVHWIGSDAQPKPGIGPVAMSGVTPAEIGWCEVPPEAAGQGFGNVGSCARGRRPASHPVSDRGPVRPQDDPRLGGDTADVGCKLVIRQTSFR